jgi:hypothetical protein
MFRNRNLQHITLPRGLFLFLAKKVINFMNVSRVFKSIGKNLEQTHITYHTNPWVSNFDTDESSPTKRLLYSPSVVRGSGSRQDNLTLLEINYTPFPYSKKNRTRLLLLTISIINYPINPTNPRSQHHFLEFY